MKTLGSYLTPVITITTLSGVIAFTEVAEAAGIATRWNFNFTGDITGGGFIEIEGDQQTETYEVINIQFTLDFGTGLGPQNVTLDNFGLIPTPLQFSPHDTSNELSHTNPFAQLFPNSGLSAINPGWNQGMSEGGNFTIAIGFDL